MSWENITQSLEGYNGYRVQIKGLEEGRLLSFESVFSLWQNNPNFTYFFTQQLTTLPFEAIFWEVKPVTIQDLPQPFEYVVIRSSRLPYIKANSRSFQRYFKEDESVVTFPNLGRDADLVVPGPIINSSIYAHLLSFLRSAPDDQIQVLWKKVAKACLQAIGSAPIWLSTHGMGVPWLHVRIDTYPKYYHFDSYRSKSEG